MQTSTVSSRARKLRNASIFLWLFCAKENGGVAKSSLTSQTPPFPVLFCVVSLSFVVSISTDRKPFYTSFLLRASSAPHNRCTFVVTFCLRRRARRNRIFVRATSSLLLPHSIRFSALSVLSLRREPSLSPHFRHHSAFSPAASTAAFFFLHRYCTPFARCHGRFV